MVPAGYSLLPLQGTTSKSVGRGDRAAKTTEKTNTEDRDEPATNNDGRQESTVKGVTSVGSPPDNNKTNKTKQAEKQGRPDQTPDQDT